MQGDHPDVLFARGDAEPGWRAEQAVRRAVSWHRKRRQPTARGERADEVESRCGQGQFAQRSGCAEAAEAEDDSVAPTRFSAQRFRPPRSPTVLASHGRTLRRTLATPPALVTVLPLSLNIRVNIHALCSPWAAASRSRIAVYV